MKKKRNSLDLVLSIFSNVCTALHHDRMTNAFLVLLVKENKTYQ